MKTYISFLVFILFSFITFNGVAQNTSDYQIHFRNRVVDPTPNISAFVHTKSSKKYASKASKFLVVIQFEKIPTSNERQILLDNGVVLLDYLPTNAFLASVQNQEVLQTLGDFGARAIVGLIPDDKIHTSLLGESIPTHARVGENKLKTWISFPKTYTFDDVKNELVGAGFTITSEDLKQYQIVEVEFDKSRIYELATLECIKYIQPVPGKQAILNDKTNVYSRSNLLKSNLAGGLNLSGKDIVIGVGDDGDPYEHIDISRQTINHFGNTGSYHGVHVMGIVAGRGIINEKYTGMAPKSRMVVQDFSKILFNSSRYVQDYGMVITNNSYGVSPYVCNDYGVYDFLSKIVDDQAFELPSLLHVYAAGNSGRNVPCNLPAGFGTVLSGYQTSKNATVVGNVSASNVLHDGSSRGPVKDGRVKPEIVTNGTGINSTSLTNRYLTLSGTSLATPSVSGGLALLYERYRQLHGNTNPSNALMKAILVNGATDIGPVGVDYQHGYGAMNLNRSVQMLNSNHYFESDITQAVTNTHTFTINPNSALTKVMLYWNDPASSMMTPVALVNNLDLTVTDPNGTVIRPHVLNPNSVAALSAPGVDDLNNMEQVVIENPIAGTYTVKVAGKSVPQGQQKYVVVYDVIQTGTTLTYPMGAEKLTPGDAINVTWDSYGNSQSTFKVEYSVNGGVSWSLINDAVPFLSRQVAWTVPNVSTGEAKVRITQSGTNEVKVSENFAIIGLPVVTLNPIQCEEYISINWTAVSQATDYEVMILEGDDMKSVGFTNNTSYNFNGLSSDSTYYVTVRARMNGVAGRRALAVSRKPSDGDCTGSISDQDLSLVSVISPVLGGRKFTSTQLTSSNALTVRIKNLDDVASGGSFRIGYALGSNPVIWETISPTIGAKSSYDHTFKSTLNMSAIGTYPVKIYIEKQNDPVVKNNELSVVFRQLANEKLSMPFLDNFDNLNADEIIGSFNGVGESRYDLKSTTEMGRLRTYPGVGLSASGSNAIALDVYRNYASGNTNYLIGTYNFTDLNVNYDEILLTFKYKNYGQYQDPENKVWIRGNDTAEWIQVFDLYANQDFASLGYKQSSVIEVSKLLRQADQQFSSSFQIKWGQQGTRVAADGDSGAGYSFDDINMFTATDDIRMVNFIHPVRLSCGLGNRERVKVAIRNNSSNTISNIPVNLQIDGGNIITETIPSIPAGTTITYTFLSEVDVSDLSTHILRAWSTLPSDTYTGNNQIEMNFFNSLPVSQFPHFQNFELNSDGWIAESNTISWQYGTPTYPATIQQGSGQKIWKTNLSGNYSPNEESYLYSPCYDIGGMENPTLSFNMKYDIEYCNNDDCDLLYLEYSADGNTWNRLGSQGSGTNWYNVANNTWSGNDNQRWKVRTISFPQGINTVRFRFVFKSDAASQLEGVSIEDIHVYDLKHEIATNGSSNIDQKIADGNDWTHFVGSNGILASLHTNNQSLGNTSVQAFTYNGNTRNVNQQYYLNRNITIKPQNQPVSGSVKTRLYILDSELEAMINSSDCANCTKPESIYELFISKYHDNNIANEDGVVGNNSSGAWKYFVKGEVLAVPYGQGYYLEFETQSFSEFWFAKGSVFYQNALPVRLNSFKAEKRSNVENVSEVLLTWTTSAESDFSHFELQTANTLDEIKEDRFTTLTSVAGKNKDESFNTYSYIDLRSGHTPHRYYRLKMIDLDGSVAYSTLQNVSFEVTDEWYVYPNPSNGVFQIKTQAVHSAEPKVRVYDLGGKIYKEMRPKIDPSSKEVEIDLSDSDVSPGMYILEVSVGDEKRMLKAIKN